MRGKEGVSRIARDDDIVATVTLQALGTVIHGKLSDRDHHLTGKRCGHQFADFVQ